MQKQSGFNSDQPVQAPVVGSDDPYNEPGAFKWKGIRLDELSHQELIYAHRKTLKILHAMWMEIGRRKLTKRVFPT